MCFLRYSKDNATEDQHRAFLLMSWEQLLHLFTAQPNNSCCFNKEVSQWLSIFFSIVPEAKKKSDFILCSQHKWFSVLCQGTARSVVYFSLSNAAFALTETPAVWTIGVAEWWHNKVWLREGQRLMLGDFQEAPFLTRRNYFFALL